MQQAETVKAAQCGKRRRSVWVSIKSGTNCESHLFCQISTTEKFDTNFQPLPLFTSKAMWQELFLLQEVELFCHLMAPSGIAFVSLSLWTYGYTPSLFLLSCFSLPLLLSAIPPLHRHMDTNLKWHLSYFIHYGGITYTMQICIVRKGFNVKLKTSSE